MGLWLVNVVCIVLMCPTGQGIIGQGVGVLQDKESGQGVGVLQDKVL